MTQSLIIRPLSAPKEENSVYLCALCNNLNKLKFSLEHWFSNLAVQNCLKKLIKSIDIQAPTLEILTQMVWRGPDIGFLFFFLIFPGDSNIQPGTKNAQETERNYKRRKIL